MKERILLVFVGQGGGNIGQQFEKLGYNCLFINTSHDDLLTIEAKHKYHIPGANGCNKNRNKAFTYAKNYYTTMINVIDSKFPMQDIVYFVFTLGGGTGSGLSPILLDLLVSKNQNKHYGAVAIMPSISESIKCQINAIESYNQLCENEELTLYVLDNNTLYNKFDINNKFVYQFNKLINITRPDTRGIIDGAELETLLTTKGSSYILDFDSEINSRIQNNIFTPFDKGVKYLGLSLIKEFDTLPFEARFGKPVDTFIGFNNESNLLIAAGMTHPQRVIRKLIENVNEEQNKIDNTNNSSDNMPDLKIDKVIQDEQKSKRKVDVQSIFEKYAN